MGLGDAPLREVFLAAGLHAEETPAHVDQLPGQEQGEPGQAGEASGAGTEDGVALLRVRVVAVDAKVTIAEAEEDERE